MKTIRHLFVTAALLLGLTAVGAAPVFAQTALNSTTLSAAVVGVTPGGTSAPQVIPLASISNIAVKDILFVDREFMCVTAINAASVQVQRGCQGSTASAHVTGALVYTGAKNRFYGGINPGACTRTNEQFLPRIVMPSGDVWDCPTGAGIWTLYNSPDLLTARSEAFNLDNGAGTTIDAVLIRPARPIVVTACRIVYEDATTGTVAAGNAKVGVTVGGAEIVAATAYENTKAVGTTTAMAIVAGYVSTGTPVLVRHTGVAATQAGESVVECDYRYL